MAARLDYRWHLRQVMARRDMFATTDLLAPLAERGIHLSVAAADSPRATDNKSGTAKNSPACSGYWKKKRRQPPAESPTSTRQQQPRSVSPGGPPACP